MVVTLQLLPAHLAAMKHIYIKKEYVQHVAIRQITSVQDVVVIFPQRKFLMRIFVDIVRI